MSQDSPREWGEYTKKAMELAAISQSELARRLTKKLGRQITQGALQSRLSGHPSQPPLEPELSAWADALKLEGFHRSRFVRLAMFSRTPLYIPKELMDAEARLSASEVRTKNLEKLAADLRAEVADLRRELSEATAQAAHLLARIRNQ